MASGTLERCSLHGWIPVFTVQGRWQTECIVSCGWVVCWCQWCGSSGPWWRWDYSMGRPMLWTTNTGAFYWWHFHNIEIPLRDPEAHCCAPCCSMIMHGPMLERSVHNSWKLKTSVIACPAYSPDMSLIEHVWDALDWRIRQRVPVPANIQHSHWRGVDQHYTHATINNLINSMQRRCVALREANGGHTRYWLVFGPPPIQ